MSGSLKYILNISLHSPKLSGFHGGRHDKYLILEQANGNERPNGQRLPMFGLSVIH